MTDSEMNNVIMTFHRATGAPIWECKKAIDLAMKYISLRHPIGDHPEDYIPREYELREIRRE